MEKFKKLNEIIEPDPRTHMFKVFDEELGDFREREINEIHKSLELISLHKSVPEEIRNHFITSKHLALYSWFVYRFIPVAEFHAMSSVEFALKLKTGKKRWGLKRLLSHAVKKGWIKDADFEIHQQTVKRRKEHSKMIKEVLNIDSIGVREEKEGQYTSVLIESLPYLRNVFAHGSNTIAPQGYLTLKICAETINKVYDQRIVESSGDKAEAMDSKKIKG